MVDVSQQLDNASSHKNARLPASLPDPDLPLPLKGTFPCTSQSDRWPVRLRDSPSYHSIQPLPRDSGHFARGKEWLVSEHKLGGASMQGKGQPGSTVVQRKNNHERTSNAHQTRLWLPLFPSSTTLPSRPFQYPFIESPPLACRSRPLASPVGQRQPRSPLFAAFKIRSSFAKLQSPPEGAARSARSRLAASRGGTEPGDTKIDIRARIDTFIVCSSPDCGSRILHVPSPPFPRPITTWASRCYPDFYWNSQSLSLPRPIPYLSVRPPTRRPLCSARLKTR